MSAPQPLDAGRPDAPPDAWERHRWQFPVATTALLVVATGLAAGDEARRSSLLLLLLLAGAFGGWQAAWRPWRRTLEPAPRLGIVWGLGTVALWTALTVVHPAFYLLLFVTFSLLFSATAIRVAIGLAVAQSLAIAFVNVRSAADLRSAVMVGVLAVLGGLVSIGLGSWTHGIIEQSRSRAALIQQLEATRAELAEAERTAGALAERARWAGEVHDTLAQGFTSIVVLLEAVRGNLAGGEAEPASAATLHRLDLAVETARANLAEARHLVADLGPAALADTSLPDAVRRAAGDLAAATGARVDVTIEGRPHRLPADHEVAILRVAQESLTNVRRHAGAAVVEVALRYGPDDAIGLDVHDDGQGFDAEAAPAGFGLQGMAGRLRPLGGEVSVDSAVGGGTRVAARLP